MHFVEHLKIRIAHLFPHARPQKEGSQEQPDELISIDSLDFSGRPQGAQDADSPLYAFPELWLPTPPVKYLPGGPPPPSNELSLLSFSRKSSPNELALWYSSQNTTKSTKNSDFGSPFGQSFLYGILFFEQKMCILLITSKSELLIYFRITGANKRALRSGQMSSLV